MGGHPQARRTCAAALWSFLLGLALAAAEPAQRLGLFPAQSAVILLVGVPGDLESEENYRDQLQGWLDLLAGGGEAARVFVLCDNPQAVTLPGSPVRTRSTASLTSNSTTTLPSTPWLWPYVSRTSSVTRNAPPGSLPSCRSATPPAGPPAPASRPFPPRSPRKTPPRRTRPCLRRIPRATASSLYSPRPITVR